jgi:hypothetical protein
MIDGAYTKIPASAPAGAGISRSSIIDYRFSFPRRHKFTTYPTTTTATTM